MAKIDKYSIQDLKRDFPNEEACLALIFDTLHSRKCSCGGEYKQIKGRKQFQCGKCRFQIAPASTTIFHKSDTPLSLWFHAIFIFSNAKSGISAKELERQLGVTYKCAWRILSMIRKALKQNDGQLLGTVEMDSAYFGGKGDAGENNKNLSEVIAKKSVVTAAVRRGKYGEIRAKVGQNVSADALEKFVKEHIARGGRLMTDNAKGYRRLDKYSLSSVDHGRNEFARGDVHINTIEGWFGHVKRSMKGTFKSVSKKHLQSYLDAFVFHYNNRHNDKARFGVLLGALLQPAK
ncbi:MAG: IS1595 family transposase [bacterium]